jgi:hypothetical protein
MDDETAYLLGSPENAERLLAALEEAARGEGVVMTLDELRAYIGLAKTNKSTLTEEEKEHGVNRQIGKQLSRRPGE